MRANFYSSKTNNSDDDRFAVTTENGFMQEAGSSAPVNPSFSNLKVLRQGLSVQVTITSFISKIFLTTLWMMMNIEFQLGIESNNCASNSMQWRINSETCTEAWSIRKSCWDISDCHSAAIRSCGNKAYNFTKSKPPTR